MLRGINKQDMFEDDEDYLQMTSIKTKMITEPSLGHFSSKKDFTHGLTVRQWLNGQSYAAQYEFGLSVLKKYGY